MRFPALQSKDFVLYTAGNASAMVALWINRVIIGWLGWELTGLASWVGLLAFFLFAPTIVASPLFGVLLDRIASLAGTRTLLIDGRHDPQTTATAEELRRLLPLAEHVVVEDASHAASNPNIASELVRATDRLATGQAIGRDRGSRAP